MEERTYYEDWQLDNVLPVPFGPRSSSSRLPAEGARHHVIDPDGNLILSDPADDPGPLEPEHPTRRYKWVIRPLRWAQVDKDTVEETPFNFGGSEDDYVGSYVDSRHVLRFQQAQIQQRELQEEAVVSHSEEQFATAFDANKVGDPRLFGQSETAAPAEVEDSVLESLAHEDHVPLAEGLFEEEVPDTAAPLECSAANLALLRQCVPSSGSLLVEGTVVHADQPSLKFDPLGGSPDVEQTEEAEFKSAADPEESANVDPYGGIGEPL